jgi:flagellar biosynthetic protein FliQ
LSAGPHAALIGPLATAPELFTDSEDDPMDFDTVMLVAHEALEVTMYVCAPILLTALVVGLVIGMVQAATQIQEMTLSFIPKMIGMGLAVLVTGPWMLHLLVDFTERLYERIPGLVG